MLLRHVRHAARPDFATSIMCAMAPKSTQSFA